jgi:hypothetical protein
VSTEVRGQEVDDLLTNWSLEYLILGIRAVIVEAGPHVP